MKVKEFVTLITDSINPQAFPNTEFSLFSLPAFDNAEMPEITLGQNIQSNKYIVPNKCILFNKLNVRFRRIWCVESDTGNKIASTEFLPLVVNEELVDYNFCYFLLLSNMVSGHLEKQTTNTSGSHKRIEPEELLNIDVNLPPIEVQHTIGSLLSSIEKRRHNNSAVNTELEAMAKDLYDYWFLQFEFPDENGKPYKSSGGKMVWNERLKREIPAGWKVDTLRGKYSVQRGLSYSSKDIETGEGVPMINLASVDRNRNYQSEELKYYSGKISKECFLNEGDLLIACTDLTRNADIVGSPILVPDDNNKYTYSMDMAKLESTSPDLNEMYLYATLRTDFYHNYIKRWASGTNVLHLNLDGLDWYTTWYPPIDLQSKYGAIIKNIHKRKSQMIQENQELASLRDFLLPLLMNGQVGFKEKV